MNRACELYTQLEVWDVVGGDESSGATVVDGFRPLLAVPIALMSP